MRRNSGGHRERAGRILENYPVGQGNREDNSFGRVKLQCSFSAESSAIERS